MNPARKRAYIELLIVAIIWGAATPIIKYTLGGFDSVTFLTYRFGLSTLFAVLSFLYLKARLPKDKQILKKLLCYAFLTSTVSLGFLFFGLENTTALDASLITLANPILITVAGAIFLRERVTKREKLGMTIALAGTLLTVIEPLLQNHGGQIRLSGNVLIVGYLISTAWGAVLAKQLLRSGVSPIVMTNTSFIVGFLSLLPFFLATNSQPVLSITSVAWPYHLGVFYMAFLSGNLAYYLGNKAQKTVEIGEASLFSYLYPVFSTPLAVLWLGEKITPIFVLGGVIIVAGVILAEMKKKRYN
jgi:drug/metabolite transporter (DMT)-like permease